MNVFDYLNYLREHYYSLNNFLDIIGNWLNFYLNLISFYNFSLSCNLQDLVLSLIYDYFPKNLFLNLFLDKLLCLSYDFLYFLPDDFHFMLMVYLLCYLFNLVHDSSNRHISICLHFNWNLFVMNKMLGFWYFNDSCVLNNVRNSDWI